MVRFWFDRNFVFSGGVDLLFILICMGGMRSRSMWKSAFYPDFTGVLGNRPYGEMECSNYGESG